MVRSEVAARRAARATLEMNPALVFLGLGLTARWGAGVGIGFSFRCVLMLVTGFFTEEGGECDREWCGKLSKWRRCGDFGG